MAYWKYRLVATTLGLGLALASCKSQTNSNQLATDSVEPPPKSESSFNVFQEGPFCAGKCWEEVRADGVKFVNCGLVLDHGPVPESNTPSTSCKNIVKWYADTGNLGSHMIMQCDKITGAVPPQYPDLLRNCKQKEIAVRASRLAIEPIPGPTYPLQTIGNFLTPGAPLLASDPNSNYCSNETYYSTITQTCAPASDSNPQISGVSRDCANRPIIQWSKMTGARSIYDTNASLDQYVCAMNMLWAVGGMAPALLPPATPPAAIMNAIAIIGAVGGVAASAPACRNAFDAIPGGRAEWTPVKANGGSTTYNLLPAQISPGFSGTMTFDYLACQRELPMRWAWGFTAVAYSGHYVGQSSVEGYQPPLWTRDDADLVIGSQDSGLGISGTRNEPLSWKFAEACVRKSEAAPLGVDPTVWDAKIAAGWEVGGGYLYKKTGSANACAPTTPTTPTMPTTTTTPTTTMPPPTMP